MNRKLIAMATAIMLALSMTACGGSESSSTTEEEALKKEIQEELDGEKKADEAEADSAGPIEYAPTQEILDADFSSGLVQVGNDVFKCGGYLTVGDFLEQYGDRYEAVSRDSLSDEYELFTDFDSKISEQKNNEITFRSKKDKNFFVDAEYVDAGTYEYDSNATLRDAVIYNFEGKIKKSNTSFEDVTFYPSGIDGDLTDACPDLESIKELFSSKLGTTKNDDVGNFEIIEYNKPIQYALGVSECEAGTLSIAVNKDSFDERKIDYHFATNIELQEDNLFGYKPVICFLIRKLDKANSGAIKAYYYQFKISDKIETQEKVL